MLAFLLMLTILIVFLALHQELIGSGSVNEFIWLSTFFVVYTPMCALKMMSSIPQMTYLWVILLNVVITLSGGIVAILGNSYIGNVFVLTGCIINIVILLYLTTKSLLVYIKTKESLLNMQELTYILPLWFFPFLINNSITL